MKKVFLTMALVFASSNLINANAFEKLNKENSVNNEEYFGCLQVADAAVLDLVVILGNQGIRLSYYERHKLWLRYWDLCQE